MSNTLRDNRSGLIPAALAAIAAFSYGGFHIRTFGFIALAFAILACIEAGRGRIGALRSEMGIGTLAFALLTLWTAASITWVFASRHDAWVETVRTLMYGSAFVVGGSYFASKPSLRRAVAWMAASMSTVTGWLLYKFISSDAPLTAFVAGRLDAPIGYAPGVAAFFIIAAILLIGISVQGDADDPDQSRMISRFTAGAALGAAVAAASMAGLAQSRGSLPAIGIAFVLGVIIAPSRISWLWRLSLAGIALLLIRDKLADVFQTQFDLRQAPFNDGDVQAAGEAAEAAVRSAGIAIAVAVLAVTIVATLLAPASERMARMVERAELPDLRRAAIPIAVLFAAVIITFSALQLSSDDSWVSRQLDACTEFSTGQAGDPGSSTSHFSNVGTGRCDYYRVAVDNAKERPLRGVGAANFAGPYVLKRKTGEAPEVAHSLPLQILGELGIAGLLLSTIVVGVVGLTMVRFTLSDIRRDPVVAAAIIAAIYWAGHASVDWLWQLPGVTLPVVVLMGGLVATVNPPQQRVRSQAAGPIAVGLLLVFVAAILPPTMADRNLRESRDTDLVKNEPTKALELAQSAATFDPSWAEPQLRIAALQFAAGKKGKAAKAAEEAVELEPNSWRIQLGASGVIGARDTAAGRDAFRRARQLNPQLPAVVSK